MGQYAAIDALDPSKFTQRDKYLLSQAIAAAIAEATTARTGRSDYSFNDTAAGYVVAGEPNGVLWRFYVNDGDPVNPKLGVEKYADTIAQMNDVIIPRGSGPVVYGQYNAGLFRWGVNDTDQENRKIVSRPLASESDINSNDVWFEPGASFLNRGRSTSNWWKWLVNDTDLANWKNRVWPISSSST